MSKHTVYVHFQYILILYYYYLIIITGLNYSLIEPNHQEPDQLEVSAYRKTTVAECSWGSVGSM